MRKIITKVVEVDGTKNIIHYPEVPRREDLVKLYDVFNEIFKDHPECFYTHEQVEQMKKDKTKIFL